MLILIILIVLIFPVHECLLASVMSDSATVWTIARQTPLSMGFCRQEYQSELPCPPPRDLPDPGIERVTSASPALQADSLPSEAPGNLSLPTRSY